MMRGHGITTALADVRAATVAACFLEESADLQMRMLAAAHPFVFSALQGALKDPDLIKRFDLINTEPIAPNLATPEALQKHLFSEVDRWAPIIKASGEYAD